MKLQKFTIKGIDQYGTPVTEQISVPRYNVFERLWFRIKKRFRPQKVYSGIKIKS